MLFDRLYASFSAELPPPLAAAAGRLPAALGLAPIEGLKLSEVFSQPITLGAPELLAKGLSVEGHVLEQATLVHVLSVLQAFAIDRMEDGQARVDNDVARLLDVMATRRDVLCVELGCASDVACRAEAETYRAIAMERRVFAVGGPAGPELYENVSRRKQALGLIGTVALCTAAATPAGLRDKLGGAMEDAATALQLEDDVLDWEEDFARSQSWLVRLADTALSSPTPSHTLAEARTRLAAAGTIGWALDGASELYARCAAVFGEVGSASLDEWANDRRASTRAAAAEERANPGYCQRRRALRNWARDCVR